MHSTLRRELCGTPKFLQSVRTRPVSRSPSRRRKFSTRTYLLNQSSSKDNTAASANSNTNSKSSENPDSLSPHPDAPVHSVGADLEKWLQTLHDKGQGLHVWESITEKDETGKLRLLPHIKKEIEKHDPWNPKDGQFGKSFGIEIQDGRIRTLTSEELNNDKLSLDGKAVDEKVVLRSGSQDKPPVISSISHVTSNAGEDINEQDSQEQPQTQTSAQHPTSSEEGLLLNGDNLISKFHGSPAARRQRERQSRLRDRAPALVLPQWFGQRNVLLWGEEQIDSSIYSQVEQLSVTFSDEASEATPSSSVNSDTVQVVQEKLHEGERDPPLEKIQTFASQPSGDQPVNNSEASTDKANSPIDTTSLLVALPNSKKRYYIHGAQRRELIMTARGRLRLPTIGSSNKKPGGIRSHILIHYTAQDGDLFLDRLIEDVASQLKCDLVTLDAQDISALISKADVDPMIAEEAKNLSYEIYGDVYQKESPGEDHPSMNTEEMEDGDEEGMPMGPMGIPVIVGKPLTIDLKDIFRRSNSRRHHNIFTTSNMPEFVGRGSISKHVPHIFQSVVDSILSSPKNKRKISDTEALQQVGSELSENSKFSPVASQDATIVHIKDLKAIQDTNIGKQFLSQMYDQVERRRANGEGIMLIGTSCERANGLPYDADRIKSMQGSELDEISSSIVITPPYLANDSGMDSETDIRDEIQRIVIPKQDRHRRIRIINARHLYEMLQSKDVALGTLREGFWTQDLNEQLDEKDQDCLTKRFWSFSDVQRIAAILASSDFSTSPHPIADALAVVGNSDKLKVNWAKQAHTRKSRPGTREKEDDEPENEKLAQIRAKATRHEKKLLSGVIEPKKINTTFKDIHIPAETVEALHTLTTLSLVRPDAFRYGVLASDRIPGLLLYGPPGTGKTLAAKAVARESGATMLEVSAADINDMYVGEGEKNVKALFSLAKKLSPCVVFLDEADAMFSARSNAGRRVSHRELLNQFLKEWDGMSNDSGSAFIMVATNRPMDLDDAVLRRLPRRLLVDLPTEKDRLEILKIHLRHERLADDVDLAKIASRTQFYSGSDLKNVAVAAALNCVRAENALAKQHTGNEPFKYPEHRILTSQHFDNALEEISASISEDMTSLRDIKKFDEQYGDRKGRKRRLPKWGFKTASEADAVLDTVKVRS